MQSTKLLRKHSNEKLRKHFSFVKLSTTKGNVMKNIHTAKLKRRNSGNQSKFRSLKALNPKNRFQDCQDLMKIKTLVGESLPNSSNLTPTYMFNDEVLRIDLKDTSHDDLSDESASLYYPNEPKIHNSSENRKLNTTSASCERVLKKITIRNPKIIISNKEPPKNPTKIHSKIPTRPFKDLSELILHHSKSRSKGKIYRGLCYSNSKSPVSRLLHNLKLFS